MERCGVCKGRGEVIGFGMMVNGCKECDGKGEVAPKEKKPKPEDEKEIESAGDVIEETKKKRKYVRKNGEV